MKNLIKILVSLICVNLLTACSMQELTAKILPDSVEAHAEMTIDAVMQKDSEFFAALKNENLSQEQFDQLLSEMFSYVSTGEEVSRDIVGATSNVSIGGNAGENRRDVEAIYEVKTGDGYTLITLNYIQATKNDECCKLDSVNVQLFETSPVLETFKMASQIAKIVGGVVLIGVLAMIFFILRRRKRRKVNASSDS